MLDWLMLNGVNAAQQKCEGVWVVLLRWCYGMMMNTENMNMKTMIIIMIEMKMMVMLIVLMEGK